MKPENPKPVKTAFSFYLEAPILERLKQLAKEQRRSVNFIVTEIITQWLRWLDEKQKGEK